MESEIQGIELNLEQESADKKTEEDGLNKKQESGNGKLEKNENIETVESITSGTKEAEHMTTDDLNPAVLPLNENVRVIKRPYPKIDDNVKYVILFEPDFTNLVEVSPVSPTKAWVYNLLQLRLVDIEKGYILHNYELEGNFYNLHGLDDNNVLFLDLVNNTIVKITMEDGHCRIMPLVDVNARHKNKAKDKVERYMVRKSGEIVVVVERKEGPLCFEKCVHYIQRYSGDGSFLREYRLQQNNKNLCGTIYSMTEYNGEICIASQHGVATKSDWVVVLNSDFKPHISYDGIAGSNISLSSVAGTAKNQVLIVVNLEYIDIIDKFGNFIRNLSVEGFSPEGKPNVLAVDNEDKAWIVTSKEKIVCYQLN